MCVELWIVCRDSKAWEEARTSPVSRELQIHFISIWSFSMTKCFLTSEGFGSAYRPETKQFSLQLCQQQFSLLTLILYKLLRKI